MNRLARYALLPLAPLLIAAQDPGEIEIEPVPPPEELRSEAFVAAQYAQISSAAAAVDKVTARFSAGDNALAQLEQQRDEKLAELQAIDRQFTALIERGDQVSEEQRRELAERRRSVREEVTAIEDRINTDFPQYFELTRPKPLAIAQAQALLNEDEAMLVVLVADDASYVWGLTRDKADWIRSEAMNEKALAEAIVAEKATHPLGWTVVPHIEAKLYEDEVIDSVSSMPAAFLAATITKIPHGTEISKCNANKRRSCFNVP